MKSVMRLFGMVLLMMAFFGMAANAQTSQSHDSSIGAFQEVFGLSDKDLTYASAVFSMSDYPEYMYTPEPRFQNQNVFGNFTFSSGLERVRFSSFSCVKNLVGYGVEGTTVGILVYTKTDDGLEVLDYNVRELGASGLYSNEVSFGYNQVQYMVVAVKDGQFASSKVFEVTTKKASTKSYLENIDIKFIPNEPTPKAVPEFVMPVTKALEF